MKTPTAAETALIESLRHNSSPGLALLAGGLEMGSKPTEGNGGIGSFFRLTRIGEFRVVLGYLVDAGNEARASWEFASSLKAARLLNRTRRAATVARLAAE